MDALHEDPCICMAIVATNVTYGYRCYHGHQGYYRSLVAVVMQCTTTALFSCKHFLACFVTIMLLI